MRIKVYALFLGMLTAAALVAWLNPPNAIAAFLGFWCTIGGYFIGCRLAYRSLRPRRTTQSDL